MLSNVIDIRDRLSEKLNGKITITKRALIFSLLFILLLFGSLSGFKPFWLRQILGMNSRFIWLPGDPENKQGLEVPTVDQYDRLFRMKCRELQESGAPQNQTPRRRRARR